MPILDIYGETSPDSELILDITSRKFGPLVMDLLPHGAAWDREDPVLGELVMAESLELSRVDVRARALERELDPSQTFELLPDWEASYGLPECAQPTTLEGRRAALTAKLLSQAGHDHSFSWWEGFFGKLGYPLHFVDLGPGIMTCEDDCIDLVNDEAFLHALATNPGLNDDLLECFVYANALLISFPIVHYLWQQQLVPGFQSLRGIAGNVKGHVVTVGLGGNVFYANPSLTVWTAATGVPALDVRAVCAVDDVFVAVGHSSLEAIRSDDGGKTWQVSAPFIGNTLNGISRGPLDDLVAVAVGLGGHIWRTANAGLTWTQIASPTAFQLLSIAACQGAMLAGGVNGILIRSTSNGLAPWSIIVIPGLVNNVNGVAGAGQVVVLVCSGGLIYRSTDAGLTWTQMVSPIVAHLYCVTASTSGRWTAAGAGGVIVQSLDNGITWATQISQGTDSDLRGAGYHSPDGAAVLCGDVSALITE
jgi:uncharacterized protein YmfQ (DUF2313 family)/photosystem II stability/assembly factor-like uncharacterized protein